MIADLRLRDAKRRIGAAAALTAMLFAAGCGAGGDESSGGASSGGSDSSKEIVIGNIGSYTGPVASSIAPGKGVVEAWARDLNAKGGIDGRKVRLVTMDDGGNPQKGVQNVRRLIDQEKVVAIVGQQSVVDSVWGPVASKAGVPVIGGAAFSPMFGVDPNFFPSGGNSLTQFYGMMAEGKRSGRRFVNLYCAESPICSLGMKRVRSLAKTLDMEVFGTTVSADAPNYTAACQAVKEFRADAMLVSHASAIALKVHKDCTKQGVDAARISGGSIANATWLKEPVADGLRNVELNVPAYMGTTPAIKAYRTLLSENDLGDGGGGAGVYAYAAGKLFETAVRGAGDEITPESLKKALYTLKDETLGGLAPPLTFVEGKPTSPNCYFVSTVENGEWSAPEGAEPQCAPPEVFKEIVSNDVTFESR